MAVGGKRRNHRLPEEEETSQHLFTQVSSLTGNVFKTSLLLPSHLPHMVLFLINIVHVWDERSWGRASYPLWVT